MSQLIELVRDRPVLWDRQKEVYKNRKLTRKAWVDICETLIENYDELSDQEQKAIGKCFLLCQGFLTARGSLSVFQLKLIIQVPALLLVLF